MLVFVEGGGSSPRWHRYAQEKVGIWHPDMRVGLEMFKFDYRQINYIVHVLLMKLP